MKNNPSKTTAKQANSTNNQSAEQWLQNTYGQGTNYNDLKTFKVDGKKF